MDPEVDRASIATVACSWETGMSITTRVSELRRQKPVNRKKVMKETATKTALKALAKRHDHPSLATLQPPANTVQHALSIIEDAKRHGSDAIDFAAIPLGTEDLIPLCDALSVVPKIGSINLESLATPKSLSRHVHRLLMSLVASCPDLTELILSEGCQLSAAQESEINALLEANAEAIAKKEHRKRVKEEKRLEKLRSKIPDEFMDFYHWENSNRVALHTLRDKERRRILDNEVHQRTKIILQQQKAANHQQQFEVRVKFGESELEERWDIALYEDEEFSELEVAAMEHYETSMRATLVSHFKRVLEQFQINKVEDFIKTKERLRNRMTIQRQHRLLVINEARRQAVTIKAEATAFWFGVHLRGMTLKKEVERYNEMLEARREAAAMEQRAEETRKQQVEQHAQAQVEAAQLKHNMSQHQERVDVEVEETDARIKIERDFDDDNTLIADCFTSLAGLHEVEVLRLEKMRAVTTVVEAFFPRFSMFTQHVTPCHYLGGSATPLMPGVEVLPNDEEYHKCAEKVSEALRDYDALLPKYHSAADMIDFRRSQTSAFGLANEMVKVVPMPDVPRMEHFMATACTMQPGSFLEFETHGGGDTEDSNTIFFDEPPLDESISGAVEIDNTRGDYSASTTPLAALSPRQMARRPSLNNLVSPVTSEPANGPSCTLKLVFDRPFPYEHIGSIIERIRYRLNSKVDETTILNVKLTVSAKFCAPDVELQTVRTMRRNMTGTASCFVGMPSFTATPTGSQEPSVCNEYTAVAKTKLFSSVKVDAPLTGIDEASIRGPYRNLVIDITEGYAPTDMIVLLNTKQLKFIPQMDSTIVHDEVVMGEVDEGRLFGPQECTQNVSNTLMTPSPKLTIRLSSVCDIDMIRDFVSNLCFASRNPAPIEGKRRIAVSLFDFSGASQTVRSSVTVERARAETVMTLANGTRSFVLVKDFSDWDNTFLSPYTFVFADCFLANVDTDHFKGGEVVIKCIGGDADDVLGLATSAVQPTMSTQFDGTVPSTASASPENPLSPDPNWSAAPSATTTPFGSPQTTPFVPSFSFGTSAKVHSSPALSQLSATSNNSRPVSGNKDTNNNPTRQVRASVNNDGLVTFGGNEIGTIQRGTIMKPTQADGKESIKRIPAAVEGETRTAAQLTVRLSDSGSCTIRGIQALLHAVCFFSTSNDSNSVRNIIAELHLGPSTGKVNEDGIVVIPYDVPEKALKSIPLTVASSVKLTVLPPLLGCKIPDMKYKERSGPTRLPQHDVTSAVTEWSSALLTVEMFPPHRNDLFTIQSHDVSLQPMFGRSATLSGTGMNRRQSLTPGANRNKRMSIAGDRLTVQHSFTRTSSLSRTPSTGRLQNRRQSHAPTATPLVDFVSSDAFTTTKVNDEDMNSVSSADDQDNSLGSHPARSPRAVQFSPNTSGTEFGGGASIGRFVRMQSIAQQPTFADGNDNKKLIDSLVDLHKAREAKEQSQKISRGYDPKLNLDANGVGQMRLVTKDGVQLGTIHVKPGKSLLRLNNVSKRDVGVILRALSFTNYSDVMPSSKRVLRVALTDGISSFSQVVTPAVFEGNDPAPNLSLLSNKITSRIGGSMLADPVGALSIVPEGRGIVAHPFSKIVRHAKVTFELQPSDRQGESEDGLIFLTPEQQLCQHERAESEALRVGPKYAAPLRYDLPGGHDNHITLVPHLDQEPQQLDTASSSDVASSNSSPRREETTSFADVTVFDMVHNDEHQIGLVRFSNDERTLTLEFPKKTEIGLISFAVNCIALRYCAGDDEHPVPGARDVKVTCHLPGCRPNPTTVAVDVLPAIVSNSTLHDEHDGEVILVSDTTKPVGLMEHLQLPSKFPHALTLITIDVSEHSTDEHTCDIDFDQAASQALKIKRGCLMIRGSNCGRLFLSRRRLKLEPSTLFTITMMEEFLNSVIIKVKPEASSRKKVTVQAHDDMDLPSQAVLTIVPTCHDSKESSSTPPVNLESTVQPESVSMEEALANQRKLMAVPTSPTSLTSPPVLPSPASPGDCRSPTPPPALSINSSDVQGPMFPIETEEAPTTGSDSRVDSQKDSDNANDVEPSSPPRATDAEIEKKTPEKEEGNPTPMEERSVDGSPAESPKNPPQRIPSLVLCKPGDAPEEGVVMD